MILRFPFKWGIGEDFMRYGFQGMNFVKILHLLKKAIRALEQSAIRETALKAELAAKDRMILSLEEQLTTASTALFADVHQMEELQTSLDRLEALVEPPKK